MSKLAQAVLYGAFAICVGYFSVAPTYDYADPGIATIKLSLSHAANRVEECVKLTPQQINERAAKGLPLNECGRERLPVTVELEIDGACALLVTAAPSGLWNDGPASVYERLDVAPGTHTITVRLRDSARQQGWDYERTESVTLSPGRYFTISFRAETGGFGFR